jgi:histidyl-tRNA synthetase
MLSITALSDTNKSRSNCSQRMDKITTIKGFKDILPDETGKWQYIEENARRIFACFGFSEIRTPILERTELFKRSIGESTDIVEKEMYTFTDRGDESLTLRPEATASVIRAYIEHALYAKDNIAKLYTIGPMFRRERPQKGRYRQFHQINAEALGIEDPRIDAELILMLTHFLDQVGLSEVALEINSLGCIRCRSDFKKSIVTFLKGKEKDLCEDCRRRITTNPLRVFDCKVQTCAEIIKDAPGLLDFICTECSDHFEKVKDSLQLFNIPFRINPKMVRGLDYYTKTAFEVTTNLLGAQNAIAGGGRYDALVKHLGGPDVAGIGFAIGFERLLALVSMKDKQFSDVPQLFIAALGEAAQKKAFVFCNRLKLKGIPSEMDYTGKSLKSQMKRADKLESLYVLILGDKEIAENSAELRNMRKSTQETVELDRIEEIVIRKIQEG